MINYTLHNHTQLCKHAIGDVEDMVSKAINDGFTLIGISDHVAYPIKATSYRMEFYEKENYFDQIKKVKEKYNDVEILGGFEAEYQEEFKKYLKLLLKNKQVDYLILGQHYENVEYPSSYYGGYIDDGMVTSYVDRCVEAMRSKMFLFVAHPDLFMNNLSSFTQHLYMESLRLIKAAIENDVYLEYNAGGIRNGSQKRGGYPNTNFWKLVAELKAPVVVNSDAHHPNHIKDDVYLKAVSQAKSLGLNIVEQIDLKRYFKRIESL